MICCSLIDLRLLWLNEQEILFINRIYVLIMFKVAEILLSNVPSHELFIVPYIIVNFSRVDITYCRSLPRGWKMYTFFLRWELVVILSWFLANFIYLFIWSIRWIILTFLVPTSQACLVFHFPFLEELFVIWSWSIWIIIILIICCVFHLSTILLLIARWFNIEEAIGLF